MITKDNPDNPVNPVKGPLKLESSSLTPTLQKPEGFRVKASEGEVVVLYFEPSATQNLKSSGFPDVLGRSSKSEAQRVNNMAKSTPSFEFTNGGIQEFVILL